MFSISHANPIHNQPPAMGDAESLDKAKTALRNANLKTKFDANYAIRIWGSTTLALESVIEPQEALSKDESSEENNVKPELEKIQEIKCKITDQDELSMSKKMIEELKAEVERRKDSEKRLFDSFVAQTSQLEHATNLIDKWKVKMASVREKSEVSTSDENHWLRMQVERLENELKTERNNEASPWEEVKRLRKDLMVATEAEENTKRAMDDLALVIREVAAEANRAREKLAITEEQVQALGEQVEKVKSVLDSKEKALDEAQKENESLKNTVARLSLQETELVNRVRKAEEDKLGLQEENGKLVELLNEAEDCSHHARYDAETPREVLRDSLAKKERELLALTLEVERLRANEAAANDNVKEMRRLIPCHSRKESRTEEKEQKKNKKESPGEKDPKGSGRLVGLEEKDLKGNVKSSGDPRGIARTSGELKGSGRFSGDLKGSFCSLAGTSSRHRTEHEPERDDDLTDSIFDLVEDASPESQHMRSASAMAYTDDDSSVNSADDFDNLERPHTDDTEGEKGAQPKKRLLRKFSELWRRKNQSQSHTSTQHHIQDPHQKEMIP